MNDSQKLKIKNLWLLQIIYVKNTATISFNLVLAKL